MGRKFASKSRRMKFFNSQRQEDGSLICHYCNVKLKAKTDNHNAKDRATIDHVIPQMYRELKAASDMSNWRVACKRCNSHEKNVIQGYIANLFDTAINPQYKSIRNKLELKFITKLEQHFVEHIKIGFWVYNTTRRQAYCQYEG